MNDILIDIKLHHNATYQKQIREKLIDLINKNTFSDKPLPSGRKMAEQLKVSRNTIVSVYESLVDDGYLIARTRSGFFVHPDLLMVQSLPKLVQNNISHAPTSRYSY